MFSASLRVLCGQFLWVVGGPPKPVQQKTPPPGIPSQISAARERRGITRYELGKLAGVPSTVVRAIEQGDDVPLSQFRAVATSLNLTIELVEQNGHTRI